MMQAIRIAGSGTLARGARRPLGFGLLLLLAALASVLLAQSPAHAGDSYTWTGGGGSDKSWTNPNNWGGQKYPGQEASDDRATIQGLEGGPSPVTLNQDITLASLTLEKGATGSGVEGGSLTLSEGLNWTGGTLETDVTMEPGSSGTIAGSRDTKLDGALHNRGTVTLASDTLYLSATAQILNSGTFRIAKGSGVGGLVCCSVPAEVKNTGPDARIEVASAPLGSSATTAVIDNVAFNAAGTIDVGGGVLEVRWAPGEIAAGTEFVGDGTFRVANKAEMFMSGTFKVLPATVFELDRCAPTGCNDPSLVGTGTMDHFGTFSWKAGDVDGLLTLGEGINTRISGPANKDLGGRIVNLGRTEFSDSDPTGLATGPLRFGGGAKFTNRFQFFADDGVEMVGIAGCCSPPAASFDNAGVFATEGAGTTTITSLGFRAGGEVNVNGGTLDLASGAATLPRSAKITGTGSVTLTEGNTMAMEGAFSVGPQARLVIGACTIDGCSTGRLQGAGTLGGGGRLTWVSGYVGTGSTGANDHLAIAEGSKLVLTGRDSKNLQSKITNRGAAFFLSKPAPEPATGSLNFGTNGILVNAGTFYLGDRAVLQSGIGCCGDSADLVNLGSLTMSKTAVPSTGSVTIDSLIFENRGTVELASGTLRLGRLGGYNQLSGATRLTGGKLESAGQDVKLAGGSLLGTGAITADVVNTGGTVAPGAPDTAGSTGILKVVGNYAHSGSGATFKTDLKGTRPGIGFDQLQVTGAAQVTRGKLELKTATGFAPGLSTKLKVLTARQRSGGGFTQLLNTWLPNGRQWYTIYNPADVTLGVRRA